MVVPLETAFFHYIEHMNLVTIDQNYDYEHVFQMFTTRMNFDFFTHWEPLPNSKRCSLFPRWSCCWLVVNNYHVNRDNLFSVRAPWVTKQLLQPETNRVFLCLRVSCSVGTMYLQVKDEVAIRETNWTLQAIATQCQARSRLHYKV